MRYDIHTVSSVDIETGEPVQTNTIGSFTDRGDAIRECVDYIVERLKLRPDIRYALMHDENHDQIMALVSARSGVPKKTLEKEFEFRPLDRGWGMPPEVENAIRDFVEHVIELEGGYDIVTDFDTEIGSTEWIFDVSKNTLTLGGDLIIKSVSYK